MLDQVRKVTARFNSFSRTSISTRVLLNLLMTKTNLNSNPACVFDIKQYSELNQKPQLQITFKDNHVMSIKPEKYPPQDLYQSIFKYTKRLKHLEDIGR
ncbi:hypothetical protein BB560_006484 [Smittium megazygosporum]|uniref:Large ribosomal subunit protein mL53 n=1 Tax=Smittium megazygosporum TaxID=133381 RepID=A0A2T9Y546_9FUNG|nr:hypothetical protein BB560_006484 [Smittium megazygosporum]